MLRGGLSQDECDSGVPACALHVRFRRSGVSAIQAYRMMLDMSSDGNYTLGKLEDHRYGLQAGNTFGFTNTGGIAMQRHGRWFWLLIHGEKVHV